SVAMVEGEMKEISEKEMVEAIKFAHEAIKKQIEAQENLRAKLNLSYREYEAEKADESIKTKVFDFAYDKTFAIASEASAKHERSEKFVALEEEVKALFSEEELEENGDLVHKYFHDVQKEAVRNLILDKNIRLDG